MSSYGVDKVNLICSELGSNYIVSIISIYQIAAITKRYDEMEQAVDKQVETCLEIVRSYNDAIDAERTRIDKLIASFHEFISKSAEYEVVTNHKTKKRELEEDSKMRCDTLIMNPLQRLSVNTGNKYKNY